ncbi:hypothetical protein ACTFIY_009362 [Dictyostelium cf. discoideum]
MSGRYYNQCVLRNLKPINDHLQITHLFKKNLEPRIHSRQLYINQKKLPILALIQTEIDLINVAPICAPILLTFGCLTGALISFYNQSVSRDKKLKTLRSLVYRVNFDLSTIKDQFKSITSKQNLIKDKIEEIANYQLDLIQELY